MRIPKSESCRVHLNEDLSVEDALQKNRITYDIGCYHDRKMFRKIDKTWISLSIKEKLSNKFFCLETK